LSPQTTLLALLITIAVSAAALPQDTSPDDDLDAMGLDPSMLDVGLIDNPDAPAPHTERVLPAGVSRVRDIEGNYRPPFEEQQSCSQDWCGLTVVNALTGRVLYLQDAWQPGALETGYGLEVVVVDSE